MNPRLYLETTIPSYLTAWPSRNRVLARHQQATREWWDRRRGDFSLYVSTHVLDEAGGGDLVAARRRLEVLEGVPLLEDTPQAIELTVCLLRECRLPTRAAIDAAHIAIATVHGMNYLLTWNCTHLANGEIAPKVASACRSFGYTCPVICKPEELNGT